jgi:hypothetical protein
VKRLIAEWTWRTVIVCALGWIGWELHQMRLEMQQPTDDQTTAEAGSDDVQDGLDDLSDAVARLEAKLDAIMMAMLQLKQQK